MYGCLKTVGLIAMGVVCPPAAVGTAVALGIGEMLVSMESGDRRGVVDSAAGLGRAIASTVIIGGINAIPGLGPVAAPVARVAINAAASTAITVAAKKCNGDDISGTTVAKSFAEDLAINTAFEGATQLFSYWTKPEVQKEPLQNSLKKSQPSMKKPQPSMKKPQPSMKKPQPSMKKPQPRLKKPEPHPKKSESWWRTLREILDDHLLKRDSEFQDKILKYLSKHYGGIQPESIAQSQRRLLQQFHDTGRRGDKEKLIQIAQEALRETGFSKRDAVNAVKEAVEAVIESD